MQCLIVLANWSGHWPTSRGGAQVRAYRDVAHGRGEYRACLRRRWPPRFQECNDFLLRRDRAGLAEGTIEWTEDPDFGYEVAAAIPGVDDIEIL